MAGNPVPAANTDADAPRPAPVDFGVTILGAGSATPTLHHHPTAQLLHHAGDLFLIDCGEGTQYRFIEQRLRPNRLRHIFISHLHGDHYFGLAPLLSTLNLGGRTDDLFLYGPTGLDEILTTIFRWSGTRLSYNLIFQPVDPDTPALLLDHPALTVESLPLDHRIACTGYLFREKKRPGRLLRDRLPADVPVTWFAELKAGHDIVDEAGNVHIAAADVNGPAPHARAYAFCSDTRYFASLVPLLRDVDVLYHEATFLEDNALRAEEVYHSTARQAASIAAQAGVGRLLIGHFSSRYKVFEPFLDEARAVFANTDLAVEGQYVPFPDFDLATD
jgi:ribonuclease Z